MSWEPVIGIEVHVELSTDSKMFCGCAVVFGAPPNTAVCPTCLGLPGALPVPNLKAIEAIVAIGLALNCEVTSRSVFHRKNYFYADLPKNYQISQYDVPVCRNGHLDITMDGTIARIGIERAHMEEDTGKSTHVGEGGRIHAASATLLDFNRSGVPLVEIVSKPDIRSAAEARIYAQELRSIVAELGVSDARLEEGSIRFDANVSVRKAGTDGYGTKVEIKNMNSFRSLERALEYEIERQVSLEGAVVQETRHWDEEAGVTHSMRTKEESSDYRYFTEPDLVPLVFDEQWVGRVSQTLPELPGARRARYIDLGVDPGLAAVLASTTPELRAVFEGAVKAGAGARPAANWVVGELTAHLSRSGGSPAITGPELAELVGMVEDGALSSTAAKEVLEGVLSGEGSPRMVAETRDLLQISDVDALEVAVTAVLDSHPDAVESYRSGAGEKVVGFLVGQVMRHTQGKADPRMVRDILSRRLR